MTLLDTSGLLAAHHPSEPAHSQAVSHFDAAKKRLTHSYVLSEFLPLANSRKLPRLPAVEFFAAITLSPAVRIVWVGPELHAKAIDLILARPDKAYSIADAVSFILMRQFRLTDALTTDKHFEQEGFRRLLGPS